MALFQFNLTQARNKIGGFLAANTALADWCLAKYGKRPQIICGLELLDPPGEDAAPFLRFDFLNRTGGEGPGEHSLEVLFQIGLVNAETALAEVKDAGTGGSFKVLAGVADMMDFMELLTQELEAGLSTTCGIVAADGVPDIIACKPLYTGVLTFTLGAPNAINRPAVTV